MNKKFLIKNIIPVCCVGIILGCGSTENSKNNDVQTISVEMSSNTIHNGTITEDQIADNGIAIDIHELMPSRSGLSNGTHLYEITLKETIIEDGSISNPRGSLLANTNYQNHAYYVTVTTNEKGVAFIPFNTSEIAKNTHLYGNRNIIIDHISNNGNPVKIVNINKNFPDKIAVKVPVNFFIADSRQQPIRRAMEVKSGSQIYLAANIPSPINESVITHFKELYAQIFDQLPSVAIPFNTNGNVSFSTETITLTNPVTPNQDGHIKIVQFDADDNNSEYIKIIHNHYPIIVDSEPYIAWSHQYWNSQYSLPEKGEVKFSLSHPPSVGTMTNKGLEIISNNIQISSCSLTPQIANVSCQYSSDTNTLEIIGIPENRRFQNYQLSIDFSFGNIHRQFNALPLNAAQTPQSNTIRWIDKKFEFEASVKSPNDITASGSFNAIVYDADDHPLGEAIYDCQVIDNSNGNIADDSFCQVESSSGKKEIHASVPHYIYTNTHRDSYSISLIAEDLSDNFPATPSSGFTLEIPFPKITDQIYHLDFKLMTNTLEIITEEPKLPKISDNYDVSFYFTHVQNNILKQNPHDDYIILSDINGFDFRTHPNLNLIQTINNYPDFLWVTSLKVNESTPSFKYDSNKIISDINGFSIDRSLTSASSNGFINFDDITIDNANKLDYPDPQESSCNIVDLNGNPLSGDCILEHHAANLYQIKILNLEPNALITPPVMHVQIIVNDHDGLVQSTPLFNKDKNALFLALITTNIANNYTYSIYNSLYKTFDLNVNTDLPYNLKLTLISNKSPYSTMVTMTDLQNHQYLLEGTCKSKGESIDTYELNVLTKDDTSLFKQDIDFKCRFMV
ncbi:hypothetical protein [Cysteiniphilum sp. QT6929]|uniref:hypothetical protein n=1 Tax=Cysteiniphilum sp. QT6929 TaxID=2975055 RepID=UPI0024B36CE9|nr:hypothetical protein [Cysteiniphilum sp. QT6929]WHN66536.1 hypothetical protein NYP54_04720 [Cysteiniphilum sp. QT6929]